MSQALTRNARAKFNEYTSLLAENHEVDSVAEYFTVDPSREQELHEAITHTTAFLDEIEVVTPRDIASEKVILDIPEPATTRIDTDTEDRSPVEAHSLANKNYQLYTQHADVALKFKTINTWSKFNDFEEKWQARLNKRRALDHLIIGFNGTSAAEKPNRADKLLRDVNIGWLQQVRNHAPQQVLTGASTAGKVTLGQGGDFESLDELVYDLYTMIEPEHAEGQELIAIIGRGLINHEKRIYYKENGRKPHEKERLLNEPRLVGNYGELDAYQVPYFPQLGIFITSLDNLKIYIQEESTRKAVLENHYRSKVDDLLEYNCGYIVQNEEATAMLEASSVELI